MPYFERKFITGLIFIAIRRSGSRDDYRSSSSTRGNGSANPSVILGTQIHNLMLQGVFFYILLHFIFNFPPPKSTVFTKLLNPNQVYHFAPTVNHLHEENPSLCSTLEPLYYSSHATAVGGIRFTILLIPGHPTAMRIIWRRCRGWCLSAIDELLNTYDPHHKYW